ncbi:MAG: glycogen/starch synthase, partial [Candidatus Omnitrophota bacterium]
RQIVVKRFNPYLAHIQWPVEVLYWEAIVKTSDPKDVFIDDWQLIKIPQVSAFRYLPGMLIQQFTDESYCRMKYRELIKSFNRQGIIGVDGFNTVSNIGNIRNEAWEWEGVLVDNNSIKPGPSRIKRFLGTLTGINSLAITNREVLDFVQKNRQRHGPQLLRGFSVEDVVLAASYHRSLAEGKTVTDSLRAALGVWKYIYDQYPYGYTDSSFIKQLDGGEKGRYSRTLSLLLPQVSLSEVVEQAVEIDTFYREAQRRKQCPCYKLALTEQHNKGAVVYGLNTEMITMPAGDEYKIIYQGDAFDRSGVREGGLLIYYSRLDNTIHLLMRGEQENEFLPDSDLRRREEGWDRALIDIKLNGDLIPVKVIHQDIVMGLSRSMMAIILVDAGIPERFPVLWHILDYYMVFPQVNDELKRTERANETLFPLSFVENPLLMAAMQDKDAIGRAVDILRNTKYKSWALLQLAFSLLKNWEEMGVLQRGEIEQYAEYKRERFIFNGFIYVTRMLRQNNDFIKNTFKNIWGIEDSDFVALLPKLDLENVQVEFYAGGENKQLFLITIGQETGFKTWSFLVSIFNIGILGSLGHRGEKGINFTKKEVQVMLSNWESALQLGIDNIPVLGAVAWARDYRPFITDMDISGHGIFSATSLKNIVIYNDLLFFSRPAVAGDSLDVILDSTLPSELKRQAVDFALQGYFELFYRTMDENGKGLFIEDPKPGNIVINRRNSKWNKGVMIDFDYLFRRGTLAEFIQSLIVYPDYEPSIIISAIASCESDSVVEEAEQILSEYTGTHIKDGGETSDSSTVEMGSKLLITLSMEGNIPEFAGFGYAQDANTKGGLGAYFGDKLEGLAKTGIRAIGFQPAYSRIIVNGQTETVDYSGLIRAGILTPAHGADGDPLKVKVWIWENENFILNNINKQVEVEVYQVIRGGTPLCVLLCPGLFDFLYHDNRVHRFAQEVVFGKAVYQICREMRWMPDILHLNEAHTVIAAALMRADRRFNRTAVCYTNHTILSSGLERFSASDFVGYQYLDNNCAQYGSLNEYDKNKLL